MALEDSSDLSDRATPNRSENSSSSSFSFNTNIRKRLFKGGSRKRYPFLRRGKKTVENGKLNNKHGVYSKLYSYIYCNMGMIHFDCRIYVMQFLEI